MRRRGRSKPMCSLLAPREYEARSALRIDQGDGRRPSDDLGNTAAIFAHDHAAARLRRRLLLERQDTRGIDIGLADQFLGRGLRRAQQPLALAGGLLAAPLAVRSGHRYAAVGSLARE